MQSCVNKLLIIFGRPDKNLKFSSLDHFLVMLKLFALLILCCTGILSEVIVINNYDTESCTGTPLNYLVFDLNRCYTAHIGTPCDNYCNPSCSGEYESTFLPCSDCAEGPQTFRVVKQGVEFVQYNYFSSDCSGTGVVVIQSSGGCFNAGTLIPCVASQGIELAANPPGTNSFSPVDTNSFSPTSSSNTQSFSPVGTQSFDDSDSATSIFVSLVTMIVGFFVIL